jgi:hypothetical protein
MSFLSTISELYSEISISGTVRKMTHVLIVTKCVKAGIEELFPRQRIETRASVARQRLDERLIATKTVIARQRKNPTVQLFPIQFVKDTLKGTTLSSETEIETSNKEVRHAD